MADAPYVIETQLCGRRVAWAVSYPVEPTPPGTLTPIRPSPEHFGLAADLGFESTRSHPFASADAALLFDAPHVRVVIGWARSEKRAMRKAHRAIQERRRLVVESAVSAATHTATREDRP